MLTPEDQVIPQIEVGFALPDYAIIECLQSGFALLKRNPQQLRTTFRRYGKEFLEDQVYPFFARRTIAVFEGWPQEETLLPCIAVTLMNQGEDAGTQAIGYRGIFLQGDERVNVYSARARANVQIAHYAESQREANILCLATYFILLARRDKLETEDGLSQAAITIGDYNPNTSLKPEHAFMRMVMFNCVVEDFWANTLSPLVAEVGVTAVPWS